MNEDVLTTNRDGSAIAPERLTRRERMRLRLSSVLVCLSIVVVFVDLIVTPNMVRAGGPHPSFAGFGMAMAPLILGLACLVRPSGRFRHAVAILCAGMSFGLALELVRFPGELEDRGCTPPFIRCVQNLKQIEGAKANWALELHKTTNDTPTAATLYGPSAYILREPKCPLNGVYTIGRVGVAPRCSFSGHSLE